MNKFRHCNVNPGALPLQTLVRIQVTIPSAISFQVVPSACVGTPDHDHSSIKKYSSRLDELDF